ncbi:MAG: hypothetical protein PHU63_04400, partial [Candidatus ainarchaeum sp.]|nr:hypothetical protein [Candidatus ainarchaeum sp.]
PVFVVDSLSKRRVGAPGARLGWLAVYWPKDYFSELRTRFMNEFQTLLLPRLSQVATPIQIALADVLEQFCTDAGFRKFSDEKDELRILEIQKRVRETLKGLEKIEGVVFPDCYYQIPGDKNSGIAYDRVDNSFYLLFGFERDQTNNGDRVTNPSAARFARWLFEINNGLHIVGTTPYDCFLPPQYRELEGDFMRDVALHDERIRELFLASVNAYSEYLSKR